MQAPYARMGPAKTVTKSAGRGWTYYDTKRNRPARSLIQTRRIIHKKSAMRHVVRNFNIRTSAILVGMTICIGFLAVIFTEQWALTRLKVGGPTYDKLAMDSALVADVL